MPLKLSVVLFFTTISLGSIRLTYAQSAHGVFKVVKGDVRLVSASDGKEVKVKIGLKVQAKDVVVTGPDSRAKIIMVDKNEINVSPDSRVEIASYEFKPSENKKNAILNIVYGKVRAKVNQKYEGNNTFQVKTPTAVAGVRGTDFFTSFDKQANLTRVVTFEGKVAFGELGSGGAIINPVIVGAGQATSMAAGKAPEVPINLPKSQVSEMNAETDAASAPEPKNETKDRGDSKKRESAEQNEKKNNDDNSERRPANAGSSMIKENDLASSDRPDVPLEIPEVFRPPIGPVAPPPTVLPGNQDFIREVIGSSRRKIILNIQTGP